MADANILVFDMPDGPGFTLYSHIVPSKGSIIRVKELKYEVTDIQYNVTERNSMKKLTVDIVLTRDKS